MYTGSQQMPDRNDRPSSEDNGRPTNLGGERSSIVEDALLGYAGLRAAPDYRPEEPLSEPERISRGCRVGEGDAPEPMAGNGNVRDINITKLNYGYIVSVGCHKFAIETPETVIKKLSEYLKDPLATEKKWFDGKLFL